MKKPTTNKLAVATQTIRPLQSTELAQVNGGSVSVSSGTSINPSGGITSLHTSVISTQNPSGGR